MNIDSIFKENNELKEAIDYFREENKEDKIIPLDQQLNKLNAITANHIEWYLDSSEIVDPKKIKIYRLEKSKFLKRPIVLEKLKAKKQLSHQIIKRFGLYTMKTTEFCSPKETLKLIEQKNELDNKNQDLKTKVNEMKKLLDDYKDEVAKYLLPSFTTYINTSIIPTNKKTFNVSNENTNEVYEPFKNTLTFKGHIDTVKALVFDEAKERLISSSVNIKIWDLISGKCLHTFYNVHNDSINVLKLTSDGKNLITGSDDRTIKILSLEEDGWLGNPYTLNEGQNTGRVLAIVYYEPKYIIAGTHLGEINVYEINDEEEMKTLTGHGDFISALVLNENTTQLISASGDTTLKFWELDTWKLLRTINAHQKSVLNLMLNEEFLFSFSTNSKQDEIKVWNLNKGYNLLGNLSKFQSNKLLQSVILNEFNSTTNGTFKFGVNSQKQLLTFPSNQPVKMWNYVTGEKINSFYLDFDDKSKISELIITKKDKLIVGYENGIIRVWE